MIHRSNFRPHWRRFIGNLNGAFCRGVSCYSVAPLQVIIVPISSVHSDYAYKLRDNLIDMDIDVEVYDKE